jgi:hypothetical protein
METGLARLQRAQFLETSNSVPVVPVRTITQHNAQHSQNTPCTIVSMAEMLAIAKEKYRQHKLRQSNL